MNRVRKITVVLAYSGDQSGTVTKKKKLDLIANPSTQGSSLASPEPPAIVTQKATVAAAKPSVIPGKENGALRKGMICA